MVASNIYCNELVCVRKPKFLYLETDNDLHMEIFDFLPQSVRNIYRICGQGHSGLSAMRTDYKVFDNKVHNDDE